MATDAELEQEFRTFDLKDFLACSTTAAVRPAKPAEGTRLIWQRDPETGEPNGTLHFLPQYGYERDAAEALGMQRDPNSDWWQLTGGSKSHKELLDAVLVWGRPVNACRADFWLPLALGGQGNYYEELLELARQATNSESDVLRDMHCDFSTGNIAPNVIGLLSLRDFEADQPLAFELSGPLQQNLPKRENSSPISISVVTFLWFLQNDVVLLQFRAEFTAGEEDVDSSNLDNASTQSQLMRYFGTGEDKSMNFDLVLRTVQSLRWLDKAFDEQVSEEKYDQKEALYLPRLALQPCCENSEAGASRLGNALIQQCKNFLEAGYDRRMFTQWSLDFYFPGSECGFNEATDRVFAHALYLDVPDFMLNRRSGNFAADQEFIRDRIAVASYTRYRSSGIQYGFSSFSAVCVGFSKFHHDEVHQLHMTGLYSIITRLCLYQRTMLRHFAQELGTEQRIDWDSLAERLRKIREAFQTFSRSGWHQEFSPQVQPEELYRLQFTQMRIDALYAGVREQMQDATAYLDILYDRKLATIGLMLAVVLGFPALVEMWRKEGESGFFKPTIHMLCSWDGFLLIALLGCFLIYLFRPEKVRMVFRKLWQRVRGR